MKTKENTFQHIVDKHVEKYNERYAEHGHHNKALGWPSQTDNHKRFRVMWDILPHGRSLPVSLLDFGCGLGHFAWWLDESDVEYVGLDINPVFVDRCKETICDKKFLHLNILKDDDFARLPDFDYIITNGVFTEKLDTPWHDQWDYFTTIISRLWERTKHGLAFNVMSAHVDQRSDLFHVPFDDTAKFVKQNLSRKFTFRHDYGLWEYTTYVYR